MKQYLIKRPQSNNKTLIERKGKENWKDKVQEGAAFNTPNAIRHITYKIKDKTVQGLGDFKAIGIDQMPCNAEVATL
ncbi:MAG: hypothetical protein QXK57_03990 [Conexivisphaerales archaeon]